jgi:ribonucleotide monophosphatase NagD (HAD superfamily)
MKFDFSSNNIGFVLDVDGVLIQDGKIIDGTIEAFNILDEKNIPYIFLTNGGGVCIINF